MGARQVPNNRSRFMDRLKMAVVRPDFNAGVRGLKNEPANSSDWRPFARYPGCWQGPQYQRCHNELNILVQYGLLESHFGSLNRNSGRQVNLIDPGLYRVVPHAIASWHLDLPISNGHFWKQGVVNKLGQLARLKPCSCVGRYVLLPKPQRLCIGCMFAVRPLVEIVAYHFQSVPRLGR